MKHDHQSSDFDVVLVGGGLQSGLIALSLRQHHPNARVALIERDSKIGGNHTWSFHPSDIPVSCRGWIEPLFQYRWSGYEVRVGKFKRDVSLPYASIQSDYFEDVILKVFASANALHRKRRHQQELLASRSESVNFGPSESVTVAEVEPGWHLMTDTDVVHVAEDGVLTQGGEFIRGRLVIDCRGPAAQQIQFAGCGYQKFQGFEIELDEDWPTNKPILMESVADQRDGFRFLYVLPFTQRRVLVEDTRFSDTPDFDPQECLDLVSKWLGCRGIHRFRIVRKETGVLPMPFTSELPPATSSPLSGGYAGGWFHAATGYSFPMAAAFAEAVASGPLEMAKVRVGDLSKKHQLRSRYSRFLNRLLFKLVAPPHRHSIFRRFYSVLSDTSIARFYSHQFTLGDALKIVVGVPPTFIGLCPRRFIESFFVGEKV